jgi:hypothetical protein
MPSHLKNYKDKSKAMAYRNKQRKANYKSTQIKVPRRKWEYKELFAIHCSALSDRELSKQLSRSVSAIQQKRSRTKI